MKDPIGFIDRGIKYSFYALFFLVPLVLHPRTFELFEFNKLWLTYTIALVILFFWITKMILEKQVIFKRTPFDIPLGLFLLSQIISTFISIDPHVSFWGYYSRFNGGLLSLLTYIFLYYAFISNLENFSFRILFVSLLSGLVVAAWGLPSHFGYDLTCLAFRGSLDTSCWTEAFQPTIRLFSTLGQPNWLAAYFSILIPVALALGIMQQKNRKLSAFYFSLAGLFLIELLWTQSQSGFLGLIAGLAVFAAFNIYFFKKSYKTLGIIFGVFLVLSFFLGHPLKERLPFSTFEGINNLVTKSQEKNSTKLVNTEESGIELGGSDSGKIRLVVWKGALDIFKQHPILGTGVETFAFAYYKVKPLDHNLLSEWDYLYNKAHNEYLNYLATTGILGFGSYLLFILYFLYYAVRKILKDKDNEVKLLRIALVSSFVTILISNFFGFSVVIINIYLFLIPALFLVIGPQKLSKEYSLFTKPDTIHVAAIAGIGIVCLYFEFFLLNTWLADQEYAWGYNLDRAQEFVAANPRLEDAVKLNPYENLYKSELSLNLATLGLLFSEQNQTTESALFVERARQLSDEVVKKHPHNVVFYKTRIQTYFTLSQMDEKYFEEALNSIKQARILAPTDAKIAYNEGLLYGQKGDTQKAIESLRSAIKLKPNYRDSRYAISVYLIELSKKEADLKKKQNFINEAKENLEYSLKRIIPDDSQAKELLETIEN